MPISSKTAWKKDSSNYYTVGGLWFAYQNSTLSPGEYFEACKTQGFEKVLVLHWNDIKDYFSTSQPPLN